jgi:hypothetical protein
MAFSVLGLVLVLVNIAVGGLLLWLSAKIMKVKSDWTTPYMIALIVGVVGYVLGFIPMGGILAFVVSIPLGIWLVKTKYKLEWGKAILVWLIWFVLGLIVGMIIAAIVAAVFVGSMVASGASLLG